MRVPHLNVPTKQWQQTCLRFLALLNSQYKHAIAPLQLHHQCKRRHDPVDPVAAPTYCSIAIAAARRLADSKRFVHARLLLIVAFCPFACPLVFALQEVSKIINARNENKAAGAAVAEGTRLQTVCSTSCA